MFRQGKNKLKTTLIAIIVILLLTISFLLFADKYFKSTIETVAESKANQIAGEIIDQAINQQISEQKINYNDLIVVQKDSDNRVLMLQADTIKLNQLVTSISLDIKNRLRLLEDEHFSIPAGQITNNYFLAHWGPGIPLSLTPAGTLNVNIDNDFISAGINQTRHTIHALMTVDMKIAVPFIKNKITITRKVPLAEAVIVGEVPELYANFQGINR